MFNAIVGRALFLGSSFDSFLVSTLNFIIVTSSVSTRKNLSHRTIIFKCVDNEV